MTKPPALVEQSDSYRLDTNFMRTETTWEGHSLTRPVFNTSVGRGGSALLTDGAGDRTESEEHRVRFTLDTPRGTVQGRCEVFATRSAFVSSQGDWTSEIELSRDGGVACSWRGASHGNLVLNLRGAGSHRPRFDGLAITKARNYQIRSRHDFEQSRPFVREPAGFVMAAEDRDVAAIQTYRRGTQPGRLHLGRHFSPEDRADVTAPLAALYIAAPLIEKELVR